MKDADKAIIAKLKAEGRIVAVAVEHHSYPFCWRSDTPLIYKASTAPHARLSLGPKIITQGSGVIRKEWCQGVTAPMCKPAY